MISMTEQDKLDRITSLLINKLNIVGISKEEIRKYVQNNIMFFIANENILNNIYLLMNNNNLYAVVYLIGNRYNWSIYKEGHLSNISDDINIIIPYILCIAIGYTAFLYLSESKRFISCQWN